MKTYRFYDALIRDIRIIHTKVVMRIFHIRINIYHKKNAHTLSPHANDIKSPLLDCISLIIDNKNSTPDLPNSPLTNTRNHPDILKHHDSNNIDTHSDTNFDELSKYFKERNNNTNTHDSIEVTLSRSTWEHINSAMRYARQGDSRNSKMHAEIACYSCKELAHYMTKNNYQLFITSIHKNLKTTTNNP